MQANIMSVAFGEDYGFHADHMENQTLPMKCSLLVIGTRVYIGIAKEGCRGLPSDCL